MHWYLILIGAAATVASAEGVLAQSSAGSRPAAFQSLINCRAVAESADRLACFDQRVAAIAAAEERKDLVVVDREQIRKTRRSVFGLAIPNLGIFGDSDKAGELETKIEGRIKRAWATADGKWIFEIDDGARWAQVDSRNLGLDPRPGQSIVIRRAAMGSYLANINKQTAIRVRRVG